MKAGPKARTLDKPLPFRPTVTGSAAFEKFAAKFIRVPKGTNARSPLKLRQWQRELIASIEDAQPQPRTAGWMLPRGQGKSTLIAAYGLFRFFTDGDGAMVVVVAVDERQAGIVFGIARRMVELDEELSKRVQVFKDRLYWPAYDATFACLPAEPKRLEGLDYTLAILDEAGVASRESYETLTLAQGKRERSTVVAIGTPGPSMDSPLMDLRAAAIANPGDTSLVWIEHSAAGFEDHPVDCEHCWSLANPALGDFLHADAMTALLPPKTREAVFRRARLCQLAVDREAEFIPASVWAALGTGETIPERAEVVLALDGSFSDDTTALLLATVSTTPHFEPLAVWEKPADDPDWRVPVDEVEQAIREACQRYRVIEVIADPFRWTRSLQLLADEGLPVYEFPHSAPRLTAATTDVYSAATNGKFSHSGDPRFAEHIANAIVSDDARGIRLTKRSRSRNAGKIDLAACLVMAHSRATWRAINRRKRRRVISY
ncbi:terminase [Gordonia sp. X0973]|uniref:terminase large subunit domain-containing protein n=1 Tax=Gordonia sp. X0973 TaxID=2742602 RepID=UPI000F53138D|nr:terminase large subunit [Gordonia sp. X0973]QKT08039.1 terminase [Gordonia sp. X0973]